MNLRKLRFFCFLGVFFIITQHVLGAVTLRDTVLSWEHFDFSIGGDGHLQSYSNSKRVKQNFAGKILENEYIRAVLLPEFGGRILSLFNKVTQKEEFYQNPIGVPFGMGQGNFYYDWLMVYGGTFSTFPEPEHGKYWFKPWDFSVVENTPNGIKVRMERTDNDESSHPDPFDNGLTGIKVQVEVELVTGRAVLRMGVGVSHPQNKSATFEYWTCNTFTPGSLPGKTMSPSNTYIVAPVSDVYVKDDWWPWMSTVDTKRSAHVYEFKNLAHVSKWQDRGIAYAYPRIEKNWYGVYNRDASEGILRIADNAKYTKGLKFWTWGDVGGRSADPTKFDNEERPYVELWSGLGEQFFNDVNMAAGQSYSWDEFFVPYTSVENVTEANEYVIAQIQKPTTVSGNQQRVHVVAATTYTGQTTKWSLLHKATNTKLWDSTITSTLPQTMSFNSNYTYSSLLDSASIQLQVTLADGTPIFPKANNWKSLQIQKEFKTQPYIDLAKLRSHVLAYLSHPSEMQWNADWKSLDIYTLGGVSVISQIDAQTNANEVSQKINQHRQSHSQLWVVRVRTTTGIEQSIPVIF